MTGADAAHLERTAALIAPFGWHVEGQCEGEQLAQLMPVLWGEPVVVQRRWMT